MTRLTGLLRTAVLLVLAALLLPGPVDAQDDPLRSGPMVGYSTMKEVLLWAQAEGPASVHFEYWVEGRRERVFSTDTVEARGDEAFVAQAVADSLEPGNSYRYRVHVDGEPVERPYPLRFQSQELWQWRRDPPDFTMALGSCTYVNEERYDRPGDPYGGGYGIFRTIHERDPDVMLWLGDNTYLREADWNSRSGVLHRYSHTRALEELQPLLASTHHYAIWDDHDYGPNNSDRSWWNKETTLEAFRLFWGNPCYGVGDTGGITCRFQWQDVEVFLMDDRWHRAPNRRTTGERDYLGDEQLEWLVDALVSSRASFKIVAVGGQVLNPVAQYENYANYPAERRKLLDRLRQEGVEGVLFVTGDRHFTELSVLEREGAYPLHDLTVSPLTAGPYRDAGEEPNRLRQDGTLVTERNFALLEFSGPREAREMTIRVLDREGEEQWSRTLRADELE